MRCGTMGSVPSTFATGYLYAGLGYTTAFDAAIPPLGARHAHEEFHDTPSSTRASSSCSATIITSCEAIQRRRARKAEGFVAWLLARREGYAMKLVNPGRRRGWKQGGREHPRPGHAGRPLRRDAPADHRHVAAGGRGPGSAAPGPHPLQQPRPARQLGDDAGHDEGAGGHRGHLTHIQFHSYGGDDDEDTFGSQVGAAGRIRQLASQSDRRCRPGAVRRNDEHDRRRAARLLPAQGVRRKWSNSDIEMEAGCGIVPIKYKEKSFVHALQWAIGLEWYLLVERPLAHRHEHRSSQRRLVSGLSADHAAADGSDLSPGGPRRRCRRGPRSRPASRTWTGSNRSPRSPSSPGRARRGCSGLSAQGPSRRRGRRRRDDLHTVGRRRGDVRSCRVT